MPAPENGTRRALDGKRCIYYDGYWIRYYAPPKNTLAAKKRLIDALTKRLFRHAEEGINTPGERLQLARRSYAAERDPARKRVKGAMLAGALFNRATDIFTTVVELQQKGVRIHADNELMKQCESYFREALELGKLVRHYSGHEGIDELWGEPLKAFVMPVHDFYESRYLKVAQTMRDIDRIAERVIATFDGDVAFAGLAPRVLELSEAAKLEAETMRADRVIFEVWPRFVAAAEAVSAFQPRLPAEVSVAQQRKAETDLRLIADGRDLITYVSSARVPMAKSTRQYLERCAAHARRRQKLEVTSL